MFKNESEVNLPFGIRTMQVGINGGELMQKTFTFVTNQFFHGAN